jgi:predicted enzyme related to lactoylglutathione lyase
MADWKLSPGDWCHIDVLSADAAAARRFYGEVFGWTFEPIPGVEYVNVKTSVNGIESGIGGVAEAVGAAPARPAGIVPYILAPDMDATLEAVRAAGGEVIIPRTDVFGMGEFAHFRDPDGNVIGLWRDAPGES